jgi:hypothetical protein
MKTADQMMESLDIDPSHPEGTSVFERLFGCGYIRPGDFEVYGVEDTQGWFSVSEIKGYLPFETGELDLWKVDLKAATCVFWFNSESELDVMAADDIVISDKLNVGRFSFEG